MGRLKRAIGFVIRSINFGESDRIITVLSRQRGKLSLIAKGARKTESRFGAALELLNLSEFIYYDREGLKLLSQADLIEAYSDLKGDYERLSCALRCTRWMSRLLEDDHKEERVFMLFGKLLDALTHASDVNAHYELAFKLKLLAELGWGPRLDRCGSCSKALGQERAWFSSEKGGVLCGRCSKSAPHRRPIDPATLRGLYMMLKLPFDKLKRLKLSEKAITSGERLIDEFTAHHLRPPASVRRSLPRG